MAKRKNIIVKVQRNTWWLWVAGAALLSFTLAMLLATGQSVWFDEGYSILLAQQSWGDLFALTAVDAHPPFYYVLLKLWGDLFGWSELALRGLSALLSAASVAAVMILVRKLFTRRVALATAPFMVFAPFVLRYGYEIRMYALAALIAVLATVVMTVAVRSQRRRDWAIYAVLVTLGMLTLYMTVVVWLTHAIWLLVRSIRNKEFIFKTQWFFAYVAAILLFVPYMPVFFTQLFNSALPGIGNEITLTRLGDMYSMLALYTPEWSLGGVWSLVLVAIVTLFIMITVKVYKKLATPQREYVMLLVGLIVIPIVFFAAASLPGSPIFINRYMAHVALLGYALAGIVVALGWRYGYKKLAVALGVMVLVVLSVGVVRLAGTGNFNFERLQKPSSAELRAATICDNSTVVADDPYTYIDNVYYFGDCDLRFFSEDPVAFRGGYAPLTGSTQRIDSQTNLESAQLFHIRWVGDDAEFSVPDRYLFEDSVQYDKQIIDRYIRL